MVCLWAWLRRRRAGLVLLPWIAVGVNAVVARFDQIVNAAVTDTMAGAPDLAHRHLVYQFRSDLLLGFVLIPLLLLVLLRAARWRWVLVASALSAMLWQVVMSAEMATYAMASSYATLRTMVMAFIWAVEHPKHQFLTLPLFEKIYTLGWMALVALVIALVTLTPWRRRLWWNRAGVTLAAIFVAVTAVAALAHADPGPHSSLYGEVAMSLVQRTDTEMMSKTVPQLLAEFRADTNTHPPTTASPYVGKAKGYNVVLVVMEAMSAQVFDPSRDSLADMPNVRRLRESAFVGRTHYTSYPLTNRASFGIFTSLYTESAVGFALQDRPVKLPGMVRDLSDAGYETGYYGFIWRDEDQRDDAMMDSLGFDRIVDPEEDLPELKISELMFDGPVLQAAAKDRLALEAMRQDMRKWSAKKHPFAVAFFPEMGHDPYRPLNDKLADSSPEAGHALAVYQDAFIGEIIDELKRDGQLDHTVIVLTSDHGERTVNKGEGEELISTGKLDERMLRVPLLIYVPKVLRSTVDLPGPTSHVDIAPTVLSLLGVEKQAALQQGLPMWDPQIATRRLFLPVTVFGTSGYYERGTYYSIAQGLVYRSGKMQFLSSALPYNSEEARAARAAVARHVALQAALIDHLVNGKQ
jgi:phosphoglycerol transferase MdoB-like AlkP superfamily enzyme